MILPLKVGSRALQVRSCRARRLSGPCRCSARPGSSFQSVLQECAYVQQTIDSLGPVPQAISESWGEAWAQRVEQATSQPLLLQLDDGESCEVVVVGVNHRDPSNLAFILEVAQATQPDAVALEARAGFLDTYRQLTAAVPPQLLERVAWMPLTEGLQAAMDHITLEDRLDWHAALYDANARMAAAAVHQQHTRDVASAYEPFWPQHEHEQQDHQQHQQHQQHQHQAVDAAYGSSALAPAALRQALLGGGPRDLALSDKVAAVVVANELDVPLHGLELDDPLAYAALLAGPLGGGVGGAGGSSSGSSSSSSSSSMKETAVASRSQDGPAGAGRLHGSSGNSGSSSSAISGTAAAARHAHPQQLQPRQQQQLQGEQQHQQLQGEQQQQQLLGEEQQQQLQGEQQEEAAALAAAHEALVWRHVAEYRPQLAAAFRDWLDTAAEQLLAPAGAGEEDSGNGNSNSNSNSAVLAQLVASALSSLMSQCLPPAAHLRLTAATDRLFVRGTTVAAAAAEAPGGGGGGGGTVGSQDGAVKGGAAAPRGGGQLAAAAAQQYVQLTEVREAHFLRRLCAIAASGGPRGRRRQRVLAVVGRSHADRLLAAAAAAAGASEQQL